MRRRRDGRRSHQYRRRRAEGRVVPVTLAAAKRAIKQAQTRSPSPPNADNYTLTTKQTEPADPRDIDHKQRRQTRLAPNDYDGLSELFYECGCGECNDSVDPLADDSNAFRDVFTAKEACPNPRPVTVNKAREIYLTYQRSIWKKKPWRSQLERTQDRTGRLYGAERSVLSRMESPTLLFLSLRLSPIEINGDSRKWIHPSILADRLGDAWENVKNVLYHQLKGYDSEYVSIIATTDSAATPHRHVVIYVDDPNDEVGIDVAQSAIDSHVSNCKGAYSENHPVKRGDRDAGEVFHDIPKADEVSNETIIYVSETRGTDTVKLPSVSLSYSLNQQPHWALKNVYDSESDVHKDSVAVDGAAIAWALPWKTYSSSENFVDEIVQKQ